MYIQPLEIAKHGPDFRDYRRDFENDSEISEIISEMK